MTSKAKINLSKLRDELLDVVFSDNRNQMNHCIAEALHSGRLLPENLSAINGKNEASGLLSEFVTQALNMARRQKFEALAVLCGWQTMERSGLLLQAVAESLNKPTNDEKRKKAGCALLETSIDSFDAIFKSCGYLNRKPIALTSVPSRGTLPDGVIAVGFEIGAEVQWPGKTIERIDVFSLTDSVSKSTLERHRTSANAYVESSSTSWYDDNNNFESSIGTIYMCSDRLTLDAFVTDRRTLVEGHEITLMALHDFKTFRHHLEQGGEVDPPVHTGTPQSRTLMEVCGIHAEDSLALMLSHKANPNAFLHEMDSPMSKVIDCWAGPRSFNVRNVDAHEPLAYRCLDLLLAAGADVNGITETHNEKLVHKAVRLGHPGLLSFLLKNGADPRLPGPEGLDAFEQCQIQSEEQDCSTIQAVLDSWRAHEAIAQIDMIRMPAP